MKTWLKTSRQKATQGKINHLVMNSQLVRNEKGRKNEENMDICLLLFKPLIRWLVGAISKEKSLNGKKLGVQQLPKA